MMIFVSRVTGRCGIAPYREREVSDVFCLRFCRHRPLHTIFCDIVGDDAHIVPSADRHTADRHTADRHTADRQSHRVREQRHRRLTTNHCRGRCPHRPVFLFFGNKKDGLKTVFFHLPITPTIPLLRRERLYIYPKRAKRNLSKIPRSALSLCR